MSIPASLTLLNEALLMSLLINDILTENTVFILGAGASHVYGFPLGPELKKLILEYQLGDIEKYFKGQDINNLLPLMNEFKEIIRYGDFSTIDEFLERKRRFRELGAYFIVAVLGKREHHDLIFPQRDFYRELFYMLNLESEEKPIPPLKIVTLNYERSLEYFLSKNCLYNCSQDYEEIAQEKVSRLQIIHAHGSLGSLISVPYGQVLSDNKHVKQAVENIRIISDRFDDSDEFISAQNVISEAKNIIFLGFGYHRRTLKSLFSKSKLEEKDIYGTSFKLSQEGREVMYDFTKGANFKLFGSENEDISAFLKKLQNESKSKLFE